MLGFKEFLNEEEQIELPFAPDKNVLENNLEMMNAELDAATDTIFVNSAVFFNTVRHVLERYGIVIPRGYEIPMLSLEAETAYKIGDTGYHLYIVHNLNDDARIEGYATIVNDEDLEDLLNVDSEDLTEKDEETREQSSAPMTTPYLLRVRRSDD